jgi:hypothetical protein
LSPRLFMSNLQTTTFQTPICLFKLFQLFSILTIYHSMLSLDHRIVNNNYVISCILKMPQPSFQFSLQLFI